MTEDDLRATFARHEYLAPDPAKVRSAIAIGIARRQARRRGAWSGGAAFAVVLATLVPMASARLLTAATSPPPSTTAALNFLLVGHDRRNLDSTEPARADAIVLAHVDRARRKAHLISIPRDLFVSPGQKINAEYAASGQRGMAQLASRVTTLTGVPLDGTVAVSFSGLQKITDAVGGVRMCVDQRVESVHIGVDRNGNFLSPRYGGKSIVYEVGCRNFNGWQAIDYLRQRVGLVNGSLDRDKHLRDYLQALFNKLLSADTLTNPARIGLVLAAAGSAVELDLADGRSLVSLAAELRDIGTDDVESLAVPVVLVSDPGASGFRLAPEAADLFAALRSDQLR